MSTLALARKALAKGKKPPVSRELDPFALAATEVWNAVKSGDQKRFASALKAAVTIERSTAE